MGRRKVFTPRKTKAWEELIGYVANTAGIELMDGRVGIRLTFHLKGNKRADLDNLVKAVMDGLNGIAYMDDNQVRYIEAHKHNNSKTPGVLIQVFEFK
jgi:crossover junction endodeoxyribonuclease RusA